MASLAVNWLTGKKLGCFFIQLIGNLHYTHESCHIHDITWCHTEVTSWLVNDWISSHRMYHMNNTYCHMVIISGIVHHRVTVSATIRRIHGINELVYT